MAWAARGAKAKGPGGLKACKAKGLEDATWNVFKNNLENKILKLGLFKQISKHFALNLTVQTWMFQNWMLSKLLLLLIFSKCLFSNEIQMSFGFGEFLLTKGLC